MEHKRWFTSAAACLAALSIIFLSACSQRATPFIAAVEKFSLVAEDRAAGSSEGPAAYSEEASMEAPAPAMAEGDSLAGESAAMPASGRGEERQAGVLTAGDIDDNLNFQAFKRYLNDRMQADSSLPSVTVHDRVSLHILGDDRQGLSNARVSIFSEGSQQAIIETYARSDGVFQFFPTLDGAGHNTRLTIQVSSPDSEELLVTVPLDLEGLDETGSLEISAGEVPAKRPAALDLMLVIDTTGSMSDELDYLTAEFRSIVSELQDKYPNVSMRFGLVAYRDIGDDYVVRSFDFTSSPETMQEQLAAQSANGGGDYPEAMDQAIETALRAEWREGNTARVLFLVADAPPHQEKLTATFNHVNTARRAGLHIYPVAASGVADTAEYMMRAAAAITHGRHLFLTDDSGVGNAHAEPKIPCYVVTRLDQLMIRVIAGELAGARVEPHEDQIIRSTGLYDSGVCLED